MLYIQSFRNYEEFKELFGIREFEGNKSRKNKILLSLLKDKEIHQRAARTGDLALLSIRSMAELKSAVMEKIRLSGARNRTLQHKVTLLGHSHYSGKYSLDGMQGICEDGTPNAIRYINMENGRVFKMKAGKFMKHLIESTKFGKMLPESVINWLCEEFAREWSAHSLGKMPKNRLHVDDSFEDIYDSYCLKGHDSDSDSFDSCMVDRGLHDFYRNSVKTKAAYMTDGDGMIIARCIIFTEVFDEEGKVWRYAERQYAHRSNDIYKQALINALIEAGEIDCYKKVGAECAASRAILDTRGNSLSHKRFRISCKLGWTDELSYQDTFKWYDMGRQEADNHGYGCYRLDLTDGSLAEHYGNEDDEEAYDSYHDRAAQDVCACYYHGGEETVSIYDRDDFIFHHGSWHHVDDILECPSCGSRMLNPEYYEEVSEPCYGDLTREFYCCEECRDRAELEYKQENWLYSDYDDEWYPCASDISAFMSYSILSLEYEEKTIAAETLHRLLEEGRLHEHEGEYYDRIDEETGQPYGYAKKLEHA